LASAVGEHVSMASPSLGVRAQRPKTDCSKDEYSDMADVGPATASRGCQILELISFEKAFARLCISCSADGNLAYVLNLQPLA